MKRTIATVIMWLIMMVLGMITSCYKPELLIEDSAFVGISYACLAWVPSWIFGDLIDSL